MMMIKTSWKWFQRSSRYWLITLNGNTKKYTGLKRNLSFWFIGFITSYTAGWFPSCYIFSFLMSDTGCSLSMQDLPISNFADVCKMERQSIEVLQIHRYNKPFLRRFFSFCCHYLSLYFSCINNNNNLPCGFLQHMQIARNVKCRTVLQTHIRVSVGSHSKH